MPRGRTESELSLSERRERARTLYTRGWTIRDVAADIGVTWDTAARYRAEWAREIKDQALANPHLLNDVLKNAVAALLEIDQVRAEAWAEYEASDSEPMRAQFLNTALRASGEKGKVLQLFGPRADYMVRVQAVKMVQDKMIEWMQRNLCAECKERLAVFVETDLAPYMATANELPIIDTDMSAPAIGRG